MIGFIGISFAVTTNYNSSQSMTETCSIPYWTTSTYSFAVTDFVLIYESVTSSASVVRWLTLHSWTLNFLRPSDECLLWTYSAQKKMQSRSLLPTTSQHGHSWHRAPLGPMAIYLFSVKTFLFFISKNKAPLVSRIRTLNMKDTVDIIHLYSRHINIFHEADINCYMIISFLDLSLAVSFLL
jgi:hypothetical protein